MRIAESLISKVFSVCMGDRKFRSSSKILSGSEKRALIDAAELRLKNHCHVCGSSENVSRHPFALATPPETSRDWMSTGVSLALSAVTLPLFGIGSLMGPSKNSTARIARLELVLCGACRKQHPGVLGPNDYAKHPQWSGLQELGFTEFMTTEEAAQYKPMKD